MRARQAIEASKRKGGAPVAVNRANIDYAMFVSVVEGEATGGVVKLTDGTEEYRGEGWCVQVLP